MNRKPAPRGDCVGWSEGAARRNKRFLQCIDERGMTGHSWALTLTMLNCPESPQVFHEALHRFFDKDLPRITPVIRLHWLIEWQPRLNCADEQYRGKPVPHLHGVLSTNGRLRPKALKDAWMWRMSRIGVVSSPQSQHVRPLYDAGGWNQYVSKHCARGVSHYQRRPESVPLEWRSGTGRVWGKRGEWPLQEVEVFALDERCLAVWWRLCRRYQWARARAAWRSQARAPADTEADREKRAKARALLRGVWHRYHRPPEPVPHGGSDWGEGEVSRRLLELACSLTGTPLRLAADLPAPPSPKAP